MKVNKDMLIADILSIDKGIIPILMQSGLHCFGCPSAQMESLEEACQAHGIELDTLLGQLNSHLETLQA